MSETDLTELIELSHAIGRHPSRMVLWDEGACAMNSGGKLFVSRRGAYLTALTPGDMVEMDLAKVTGMVSLDAVKEEQIAEAQAGAGTLKPSLDAILFAYLFSLVEKKYAVHVQPVEINQIIGSPRARQFAERRTVAHEVIARGVSSMLTAYADPGLPLAKEVKRKLVLWRDRYKMIPNLIMVQNHGMIILGNSPEEILREAEMTIKSAQIFIGAAVMGGPAFLTPDNVLHLEAFKEL
jgi:rhamnose utilization protein RhaD (predicted bifunctional aldolase and dehydrogenase)